MLLIKTAFTKYFSTQRRLQNALCKDYLSTVEKFLSDKTFFFRYDNLRCNRIGTDKICLDIWLKYFHQNIKDFFMIGGNVSGLVSNDYTDEVDTFEYLIVKTKTVHNVLNILLDPTYKVNSECGRRLVVCLLKHAKLSELKEDISSILSKDIAYDFVTLGRKIVGENIPKPCITNLNSLIKTDEIYEMLDLGCFQPFTIGDYYDTNLTYDVLVRLLSHPSISFIDADVRQTIISNSALLYSNANNRLKIAALIASGYVRNLKRDKTMQAIVLSKQEFIDAYLNSVVHTKKEKKYVKYLTKS